MDDIGYKDDFEVTPYTVIATHNRYDEDVGRRTDD